MTDLKAVEYDIEVDTGSRNTLLDKAERDAMFQDMADTFNKVIDEQKRIEKELKEAEANMLQVVINNHQASP